MNFVSDVPVDSSVIDEQLTRPRSKNQCQSHTDNSARPILSTSKNGPSKCWKISPLWNGRFEEGEWG